MKATRRFVLWTFTVSALMSAPFVPASSTVHAQAGVIYACVASSGSLRQVGSPAECRNNEVPIQWNQVGPQGPQGPAGPAGVDGAVGAQGPAGPAGADGAVGAQGPAGADGAVGPQGPAGPAGADGQDGAVGPAGPAGPQGPQGNVGAQGPAGANGQDGAAGPAGAQGPQGIPGNVGPQGPAGPQGPMGATGATGAQGPQGVAGAIGPQGPAGAQGPQGPQGAQGPAGDSIAANGELTVDGEQLNIVVPPGPPGVEQLDASVGNFGATGTAYGCAAGGCYQTFTALATGTMNAVRLKHTSGGGATLTFRIREGAGVGGNVLYQGTHFGDWQNAKFVFNAAGRPNIVAGQVYTIEILPPYDMFGLYVAFNDYNGGAATLPGYPGGYDTVFSVFMTPDSAAPGSNIFMNQAGNIGINTTSPSSTLEVASGDVELSTAGRGVILRSPDGVTCRRISIDNAGALVSTAVACQ